jgi:BirA family biotin operon repressor/biotin-[acetyl-CoA-carboxylase] ligase
LAVHDAILRACDLKVDIKWPNDLCTRERKVSGILAETVETDFGPAAVVGIGINLSHDNFPAELESLATSLKVETGVAVDRELLINELLKAFAERYEVLQSDGGAEHTIREWCANSSYAFGRQVRVTLGDESFAGVTRGLESDGALRVETPDGNTRVVRAGEVTALRSHNI